MIRQALLFALGLSLAGCQPGDSPTAPGAPTRPGPGRDGSHAATEVLQARSIQVQDGDSFIVRTAGGSRRTIRLSGIDAPEQHQPHADQSRRHLRHLLDGRDLDLHVAKTDPYGRAIAQAFFRGAGGEPVDVGLAQIEAGMAWYFRRYRRDLPAGSRQRYADAERSAKTASKGLWQAGEPVPPWDFRRRPGIDR